MAVSIDWPTGVIHVSKADLALVSGSLYELDVDAFRLELKALEDDEAGIAWPRTHIHNTQVTIAGATYARQVILINGYSVEFEDGQYSVRLTGANTNLFDVAAGRLVQNQVQVIPGNSAGLIVAGSGVTAQDKTDIANEVWSYTGP